MTNKMFNNRDLPLNRMQKLQEKASRKTPAIEHDNKQDHALVIAYRNGDEEAGLQLLESYIDMIGYIYKNPHRAQFKKNAKVNIDWTSEDKEDLFQEICLHFFQLVSEFDGERDFQGLIKGKLHLRVYDNFFEDVVDHKFNEIEFDESFDFEAKSQSILSEETKGSLPSDHLELYQAFNTLGKRQREVVELVIVKGWNSTEVSQELGITPATVRKTLEHGLKKLRASLIKPEGEAI